MKRKFIINPIVYGFKVCIYDRGGEGCSVRLALSPPENL